MQDSTLTIIGNAAQDPRLSVSAGGHPKAVFRFASTPRRVDRETGRWVDGDTTYLTVICWRQLAEHVVECVHKGDPLVVTGRLRVREWDNGERRGIAVELDAQTVGHDLSRGTSAFRRVRRLSPAETSVRYDDAMQVPAATAEPGPAGEIIAEAAPAGSDGAAA